MNLLPKQAGNRYPTSRYLVFAVKSVSGQICGQKFFAETHGGEKARKCEKNGDFASFRRSAHEAVTRSQTSRATSCATPRWVKNIEFLRLFRKWSICGQKASAELHGGDAEHHLFIVARMRENVKCEFADFLQKRGVGGDVSLYRSGSLQWGGECACGAERNNLTGWGVRDIIQAGIGIGVARLVAMVQASVTWVRRRRDMGALRVGGGAETEGAHGRTGDLSDSQRCGGNSGGVCGDLRADCAADRARAECAAGGQGAFAGGAVRGVSLSSGGQSLRQVGTGMGGAAVFAGGRGRCVPR